MMHSTLFYGDWTDDQLVCSQSDEEKFRTSVLGYRPPADAIARIGSAASDAEPPAPPFPPASPFQKRSAAGPYLYQL